MKKLFTKLQPGSSKNWFAIDQVGDNQFIVTFTREGLALLGQTQPKTSREILVDEADPAALFNVLYDKLSYVAWENETFPDL